MPLLMLNPVVSGAICCHARRNSDACRASADTGWALSNIPAIGTECHSDEADVAKNGREIA